METKKLIILLVILLAIIIIPNVVDAADGDTFTVDGLKYKVLTETTVEVTGFETESTSIVIPTSVTNVAENYKVSSIADRAFLNNDFAEEITIPSSVESIDKNVFMNCSKLTEIKVDTDNAKYTAENGVLFNKNKTEIISYPEGKTETTYEVPNSVIKIGDYAFWKSSLTSIELSNSVTTIGNGAFMFCEELKTINIPDSVTTIDSFAFCYCRALTSIEIPNSVTTIGESAFEECDALVSIKIPNSLTEISDRMVYGCNLLENVTIPDTIRSIGENAFSLCKSLEEIEIPNSVNEIKDGAFSYTKIETINIPYGVKSIGTATFYECSKLKDIEIPSTVTSIGMNAFWGCISLTELTIPYSVTSIGENAFGNCTSLTIYAQNASIAEKIAEENNINFEALYRIIINADEEGVIISPKGSTVDILKGSDIDIGIKADTGYKLLSVKVNGVEQKLPLNNDMISIKDIKEDINLVVEVEESTKIIEDNIENNVEDSTENENVENPPTGDNVIIYITTFIVSIIGISAIIINKKHNTKD